MDQKTFEEKLTQIASWYRVDETKILKKEDIDPNHRNPQIEIDQVFQRSHDCEWCQVRRCSGRGSIQLMTNPETQEQEWKFYCNTCRGYWDPETNKVTVAPYPSLGKKRGRPKKNTDQ